MSFIKIPFYCIYFLLSNCVLFLALYEWQLALICTNEMYIHVYTWGNTLPSLFELHLQGLQGDNNGFHKAMFHQIQFNGFTLLLLDDCICVVLLARSNEWLHYEKNNNVNQIWNTKTNWISNHHHLHARGNETISQRKVWIGSESAYIAQLFW